jgi:hypothetical protein
MDFLSKQFEDFKRRPVLGFMQKYKTDIGNFYLD